MSRRTFPTEEFPHALLARETLSSLKGLTKRRTKTESSREVTTRNYEETL
jgi:hypothetical protein